jgi:hypothetical protein
MLKNIERQYAPILALPPSDIIARDGHGDGLNEAVEAIRAALSGATISRGRFCFDEPVEIDLTEHADHIPDCLYALNIGRQENLVFAYVDCWCVGVEVSRRGVVATYKVTQ